LKKLHWSILKRVYRLLTNRYNVARRQGGHFLLDHKNWIDTRLLIGQPYERKQIASSAALIDRLSIDLFIDVGANFGLYTVLLNLRTSIQETLAFEPVLRNYNQLCGNLFVNNLSGKVTPINKALGDQSTKEEMHIDPTSTGVSRIEMEGVARNIATFTERELIKCVKFDDKYNIHGRKVFIKIDVEGYELKVLRGMETALRDNQVVLQVEVLTEEHQESILKFLTSVGYRALEDDDDDCRFTNFDPSLF